jgi:hypothetical protein
MSQESNESFNLDDSDNDGNDDAGSDFEVGSEDSDAFEEEPKKQKQPAAKNKPPAKKSAAPAKNPFASCADFAERGMRLGGTSSSRKYTLKSRVWHGIDGTGRHATGLGWNIGDVEHLTSVSGKDETTDERQNSFVLVQILSPVWHNMYFN